jgi:hypothetical protein
LGHASAHSLATPARPNGENRSAGPSQRRRMGAPTAVIAHRAPTVARPVQLTIGLPADEVDEEGVTEVWAICWATKEATELTVSAGRR